LRNQHKVKARKLRQITNSVHVYTVQDSGSYTNVAVKPVLRGHIWDKEKLVF